MFVYSTCRSCGGLLHVTDGCTVHPWCEPKPTRLERWVQRWSDLAACDWLPLMQQADMAQLEDEIEDWQNRPPRLLDAALTYASWGWRVFPLAPVGYTNPRYPDYVGNGKKPYPGSRGFKDATIEGTRIDAYWIRHPNANIGLPTGIAFDVIDIDVPKPDQPIPGAIAFAELLEADIVPDVHGQVATASGGLHMYIPATGDGNKAGIKPGIDYRGLGGYVVAPPSTLSERGRAWSWITKPSPVITGVKATA